MNSNILKFSTLSFLSFLAVNASAVTNLDIRFVVDPTSKDSVQSKADFDNTIKPQLIRFIDTWETKGASLKGRNLRYYMAPNIEADTELIMSSYFGADWRTHLIEAKEQIEKSSNAKELKAALDANTCRFPLIFDRYRTSLNDELATPQPNDETIDRIRARTTALAAEALDGEEVMDEVFKFPRSANADYNDTDELACDYIRMTSTIDTEAAQTDRFGTPIYLIPSVVMHETGHALHDAIWSEKSPVSRDAHVSFLNEALGDAFATTFLKDPCYGAEPGGKCTRQMDLVAGPLSQGLYFMNDPHTENQALRNFLWDAYKSNSEKFPQALVNTVRVTGSTIRSIPSELSVQDPFLKKKTEVERNYAIAQAFVKNLCSQMPSFTGCQNSLNYLGSLNTAFLKALADNSPTRVGESGRKIVFQGQPAVIKFKIVTDEYGEQKWTLQLTQNAVTRTFETYMGDTVASDENSLDDAYIYLSDANPKTRGPGIRWSVNGVLLQK